MLHSKPVKYTPRIRIVFRHRRTAKIRNKHKSAAPRFRLFRKLVKLPERKIFTELIFKPFKRNSGSRRPGKQGVSAVVIYMARNNTVLIIRRNFTCRNKHRHRGSSHLADYTRSDSSGTDSSRNLIKRSRNNRYTAIAAFACFSGLQKTILRP